MSRRHNHNNPLAQRAAKHYAVGSGTNLAITSGAGRPLPTLSPHHRARTSGSGLVPPIGGFSYRVGNALRRGSSGWESVV